MNDTIPQLFAGARPDRTRPVLTWYDDATGERTELSGATLDNWVAKTANLLVDDAGLGPGDTAAVLLPPHWQTAAVLLGCWTAGVAVTTGPEPAAVGALVTTPDQIDTIDSTAAGERWQAGDRYVTGLLPLAAPLRTVPAGFADYVVEVRGQGDRFVPYQPVSPADPAWAGAQRLDHATACRAAEERAGQLRIGPAARVLIDAARHPDPLDWLLAPLAVGASIVLCGHLDQARIPERRSTEHITVAMI